MIYKCPTCGEKENLHLNYDLLKQHRPVLDVLCNNCGETFTGNMPVSELTKQPVISDDFQIGPGGAYEAIEVPCEFCNGVIDLAFEDTCSKCGKSHFEEPNSWDIVYERYKGTSDLIDFLAWLNKNYHPPVKR